MTTQTTGDTAYERAVEAAEKLTQRSDEALFEQLGLRIQDVQNLGGFERATRFSADFSQEAEDMLSTEDLKKIGRRWWARLEPELMHLLCEKRNVELGQITSGRSIPEIAAGLATAAVVAALAPPAWIIVATSILANKIAQTGLDSVCEVWKESLASGPAVTPP